LSSRCGGRPPGYTGKGKRFHLQKNNSESVKESDWRREPVFSVIEDAKNKRAMASIKEVMGANLRYEALQQRLTATARKHCCSLEDHVRGLDWKQRRPRQDATAKEKPHRDSQKVKKHKLTRNSYR
jgi:hypothetical protein